jgi:hypothetical protein
VDLVVMSLVENGMMDKKDFIVTENYNLRSRVLGQILALSNRIDPQKKRMKI